MPYKDPAKRKATIKAATSMRRLRLKEPEKYAEILEQNKKSVQKQTPEGRKRTQLKAHLKHYYNISIEEYERMEIAQGGVCAICCKPDQNGQRLAVDHDHATGRIRSLLCGFCNKGIGMFRDDPAIVQAAVHYLVKWGKP